MVEYQIIAIHLAPSANPTHYHIDGVRCKYWDVIARGIVVGDFDREYIAGQIVAGRAKAFTHVGNITIDVHAFPLNGQWYLRTTPDGIGKDNLLRLDRY